MEVTDFVTSTGNRGQLQKLRALLAKAVTESIDHTAKNTWLSTVLGEANVIVDTDVPVTYADLTNDILSNNTTPGLLAELLKASSESVIYGGDYTTQLLADLAKAKAVLDA